VVCSLWKVPDASTAAQMNLFYTNLWEKNLPPVEACVRPICTCTRTPATSPSWPTG
jgi:hypothetical protein